MTDSPKRVRLHHQFNNWDNIITAENKKKINKKWCRTIVKQSITVDDKLTPQSQHFSKKRPQTQTSETEKLKIQI